MGYATLSRSRTYIMVPRDVPPENFVTVQETRKVERVGLARCLLPPCLVLGCLLLLASILAAVGFLLSFRTYETNNETMGKSLWPNQGAQAGVNQAQFFCVKLAKTKFGLANGQKM